MRRAAKADAEQQKSDKSEAVKSKRAGSASWHSKHFAKIKTTDIDSRICLVVVRLLDGFGEGHDIANNGP